MYNPVFIKKTTGNFFIRYTERKKRFKVCEPKIIIPVNKYHDESEPFVDLSLVYELTDTAVIYCEFSEEMYNYNNYDEDDKDCKKQGGNTEEKAIDLKTEPSKYKKCRVFLEPRVVLADPKKGVRFFFETPFIEVDEKDKDTIVKTMNKSKWSNYIYNCNYVWEL